MTLSTRSYLEPPEHAELTEADFDQYAEDVAEYVYGLARDSIENGGPLVTIFLPSHLQSHTWEPPEPDPDFAAMHAAGL